MTCQNNQCGCGSTNKLDNTIQQLKALAQDFQTDPDGAAERAGEKLRGVIEAAGHDVQDVSELVIKKIYDKPKESVLAALGIGALFGLLMGRR